VAGDVKTKGKLMKEDFFDLQYRFFVVGNRPYCLWDTDIQQRNIEFLENISPEYYKFIADTNIEEALSENKEKALFASLTIRTAYSQGLETLFALIAATIQAPNCVPAWMALYKNKELYEIIDAIHKRKFFTSSLKKSRPTWQDISDLVHLSLVLENKDKEQLIKKSFAELWSHFATNFLDKGFSIEYNSIKHGLRVKPGGFYMAVGPDTQSNAPAKKEKLQLLGKSDFGAKYLVTEKLLENAHHHIRIKQKHRNWNPEDFSWGLYLISLSIQNIVSSLKILNGIPATDVSFSWPDELSAFSEPWERTKKIGITSMGGFDPVIPSHLVEPFSKEYILENYRRGEGGVIKRFKISE
jgi:hypothetical protein